MRRYFKYFFKKNVGLLLFTTLFCVIVYVAPLLARDYSNWNRYGWLLMRPNNLNQAPTLYLSEFGWVLCLIAVLIPIILFSYKMNKRSVDLYYSLPLSKRKILLVNFLVGLILMFVPYTFAFFVGLIVVLIKVQHIVHLYYLYLYLSTLIPAFIVYSVTAFVYTRVNTVLDGVISVAGVIFLFMFLFASLVTNLPDVFPRRFDIYNYLPFSVITEAMKDFHKAITQNLTDYPYYLNVIDMDVLAGGIIWLVISVAMTVALFLFEPRSRAENCGQISKSIFSCKYLLPIYAFLFPSSTNPGDIPTFLIIAFAAFAIAVIYKRTFKIGWKFAVVLLGCLIAGFLFGCIPLWI